MLEIIKDIATALTLALVCALGAWLLRTRKQQVLVIVQDLVQKAEQAISGSGMGAEKKELVVAQLQAMGIQVTGWLDGAIDGTVAWLNEKGAWYAGKASAAADGGAE